MINKQIIKNAIAFLASPEGEAQIRKRTACIIDDAVVLCRIFNTAFRKEDPRYLAGILIPNTFSLKTEPVAEEAPEPEQRPVEEEPVEEDPAEENIAEEPVVTEWRVG